jgi:hypothetical protein
MLIDTEAIVDIRKKMKQLKLCMQKSFCIRY